MSTSSLLILIWASLAHGVLFIGLVYYILKSKGKRKQYIATYDSNKMKFEDGPLLELPEGVDPPKKQIE